jgi:hypothetical protein
LWLINTAKGQSRRIALHDIQTPHGLTHGAGQALVLHAEQFGQRAVWARDLGQVRHIFRVVQMQDRHLVNPERLKALLQ